MFVSGLKPLQDQAEEAAPHLIDHFEQQVTKVREVLHSSLSKDLETVLEKFLWPKPGVKITDGVQTEFGEACSKLLKLQKPELLSARPTSPNLANQGYTQSAVLLPLEVMVRPLKTRFAYHFSGKKNTNRLDKPEYFLSHAQDLLNTYDPLISESLQPALLSVFRKTDLIYEPNYIDASSAFVTAILPMIREKISMLVPQVSGDPRLLSHLMHELMNFDRTLHDDWRYGLESVSGTSTWRGLAGVVLAQEKYFERWLQVEKDFALARYQSIIDDPDSGTLDFDSLDGTTTKPTKAAIRVNDLLETITERYMPLSSFSQKLRFLIDIQISIFDQFHSRLHGGLEAYISMTSSIGSTVQGVSTDDLANLRGVNGLDRLCRVFGSADYLERAMRDWSDDVFFVELWNDLQYRAKSREQSKPVAGSFMISDIASKTSATLETGEDADMGGTATGALFDETATAYARLRSRSEEVLMNTVTSAFRDQLRPYARSATWSLLAVPPSGSSGESRTPSTTSVDLNPVLDSLKTNLSFLSRTLGTLPLRKMGRHVAQYLDSYISDKVLMGNSFNEYGARQVLVDIEVIAMTVDRHVGSSTGTKNMRRCLEAARLLTLREHQIQEGVDGQADPNDDSLDLWTVEKRLFDDNDSARAVLDELGCERLTHADARQVLRRRVELNS